MKPQQEIDRLTKKAENLESLLQESWEEKSKLNKRLDLKDQIILELETRVNDLETVNQKLKNKIQKIKKECEGESEESIEISVKSPVIIGVVIRDGFPQGIGLSLVAKKWLVFSPDPNISEKFFVIGVKENQKFRKLTQTERIDIWDGRIRLLNTEPITGLSMFYIKHSNPKIKKWMVDNGLWSVQ